MTNNDAHVEPAQSQYGVLNPTRQPDRSYLEDEWGVRFFEWILEEGVKGHNIAVDYLREDGTWAHTRSLHQVSPEAWIKAEIAKMKAEWQEVVDRYNIEGDEPSRVRAGHVTYRIGEEPNPEKLRRDASFYGYGGQGWTVHWLDGRTPSTTTTHNLWHGGTIPPALWEELPDNATLEQHTTRFLRMS